jgi:hypothetical protein
VYHTIYTILYIPYIPMPCHIIPYRYTMPCNVPTKPYDPIQYTLSIITSFGMDPGSRIKRYVWRNYRKGVYYTIQCYTIIQNHTI